MNVYALIAQNVPLKHCTQKEPLWTEIEETSAFVKKQNSNKY